MIRSRNFRRNVSRYESSIYSKQKCSFLNIDDDSSKCSQRITRYYVVDDIDMENAAKETCLLDFLEFLKKSFHVTVVSKVHGKSSVSKGLKQLR